MKPTRRQFLGTVALSSFAVAAHAADAAPRLRVAVIGHTGRGDYGHGLDTMWEKLPETELVAVADADAKGLAAAQQKLKVTPMTTVASSNQCLKRTPAQLAGL